MRVCVHVLKRALRFFCKCAVNLSGEEIARLMGDENALEGLKNVCLCLYVCVRCSWVGNTPLAVKRVAFSIHALPTAGVPECVCVFVCVCVCAFVWGLRTPLPECPDAWKTHRENGSLWACAYRRKSGQWW